MWDACSEAIISFNSDEILDDDIAYIVENDVLLHAVNTELLNNAKNVDVVFEAKISDYELAKGENKFGEESLSLVKLNNGDTYACHLLVSLFLLLAILRGFA